MIAFVFTISRRGAGGGGRGEGYLPGRRDKINAIFPSLALGNSCLAGRQSTNSLLGLITRVDGRAALEVAQTFRQCMSGYFYLPRPNSNLEIIIWNCNS